MPAPNPVSTVALYEPGARLRAERFTTEDPVLKTEKIPLIIFVFKLVNNIVAFPVAFENGDHANGAFVVVV